MHVALYILMSTSENSDPLKLFFSDILRQKSDERKGTCCHALLPGYGPYNLKEHENYILT